MSGTALNREQVRTLDALAVERLGVPGIVLMENAARQVADHAKAMLGDAAGDLRVLIVCGGGNNGGDGFAAARHLHLRGASVALIATRSRDQYTGDAAANYDICKKLGLPIGCVDDLKRSAGNHHLIIDALLGTGLTQPVKPPLAELIDWINAHPAPKLAVDLPSGLDCDRGVPLGTAVRAARTVTFVAPKLGFTNRDSRAYTGEVHVADIGVPAALLERLADHPTTD